MQIKQDHSDSLNMLGWHSVHYSYVLQPNTTFNLWQRRGSM